MRRLILATAAVAALGGSGVAAATQLAARDTTAVSATFTATQASNVETRTCVGPDGTYELGTGTYTGTASSADPRLNGALRLKVRSVYNTTKGVGLVTGAAKIDSATGHASARLAAVDAGGSLSGALEGGAGKPRAQLLATFSASFSGSGGFTNGQLGAGSGPNASVLVDATPCRTAHVRNGSVRLDARGTVTTLSSSSIAVAPADGSSPVTCAVQTGSPSVSGYQAGDAVAIRCVQSGGQMVLVRIHKGKAEGR